MKKEIKLVEVKIKYDRFGISYVECPNCLDYKPCVIPGPIECHLCKIKFRAIE